MSVTSIESPPSPDRQFAPQFALFQLGFRPFFLLAGLSAVILMVIWVSALIWGPLHLAYRLIDWHAHEMIFGFSTAVIAGFLLTAEKNWTNIQTLKGIGLALLALIWLIGRIAPWLPLSIGWIAILDLTYLPLLTIVLMHPLLKSRQFHQLLLILFVVLLFIGNLYFYIGLHKAEPQWSKAGLQLGWMSIIALIAVMAGRVVPFFIGRGTGQPLRQSGRLVEWISLSTLYLWIIVSFVNTHTAINTSIGIIAGVFQLIRLCSWHRTELWKIPMLWILYLGYAWIPVGLFLDALSRLSLLQSSLSLHAFTSGAIGLLTIGMMSRVSLGHTGRDIHASRIVIIAFVLISLGSILRVFGALLASALVSIDYYEIILIAGMLWIAGFSLFTWVFIPILIKPRIDGKTG